MTLRKPRADGAGSDVFGGVGSGSLVKDTSFTLALVFVALLPRLFVAIAWSKEPVWDGHFYHFGAERIAAGLGYSEDVWQAGRLVWRPWIHYPVGYSALLALAYGVFGSDLLVAPILNAVFGALLAGVTHRFALHFLSTERARVAGTLVALHPGLISYSALVMTEPLAALLLMLGGLVAFEKRARLLGSVGAGALLGVGALVRPTSLLALPLIGSAEPHPRWRAVRSVAFALLATGLVLLPWTVRNCRTLDGCALISTNGGWNLAIGAITKTGRFETLRAQDGCRIVTGQVQQDRCWAQVGTQKIAADPWGWLARAPRKLAETFNHESFAIEYLHEADPVSWNEPRRIAGRELLTLAHRLLLVVAAFGAVAWPRRREERPLEFGVQAALALGLGAFGLYAFQSDEHPFWVFALLLALIAVLPLPGRPKLAPAGHFALGVLGTVILAHVLFFGEDRYHLVATPIFCLFAAGAFRASQERSVHA